MDLLSILKGNYLSKDHALLSRNLVIPAYSKCFFFKNESRKETFRKSRFLKKSLLIITFEVVNILKSKLTLFYSLSYKDKALREGFLEIEEVETTLRKTSCNSLKFSFKINLFINFRTGPENEI